MHPLSERAGTPTGIGDHAWSPVEVYAMWQVIMPPTVACSSQEPRGLPSHGAKAISLRRTASTCHLA